MVLAFFFYATHFQHNGSDPTKKIIAALSISYAYVMERNAFILMNETNREAAIDVRVDHRWQIISLHSFHFPLF